MEVEEPILLFSNNYMAISRMLFDQLVSNSFKFFLKLQFLSKDVHEKIEDI